MPDEPDDGVISLNQYFSHTGAWRCGIALVVIVWTIAATVRALRQPGARERMRTRLGDLALVAIGCLVLHFILTVGNSVGQFARQLRGNSPLSEFWATAVLQQVMTSSLPVAAVVFALVCRLFLGLKFGPRSEPPARGDA